MSAPSPMVFFDAINSYQKTHAIKTAIELEFFTAIAEGASTPAAIAARCKVAERGARILADFLTIHGFLVKSPEGAYSLTQDSAIFLNKRSPAYIGGATTFLLSELHFNAFKNLTEAVRKGGTAISKEGSTEAEHPMWVEFAKAMAPMTLPASHKMIELGLAGTGPFRILDIAAGHGMFGISLAKANPQARVTALDWPNVLEVARDNAHDAGVGDRFSMIGGSAFDAEYGAGFDIILITNFLHHFDVPTCEAFLRRVHAALAPGGRAVTLEFVPDDDRINPNPGAGFSLMMLADTPAGDAYTFKELDQMLRNAGFGASEIHPLEGRFQSIIVTAKS